MKMLCLILVIISSFDSYCQSEFRIFNNGDLYDSESSFLSRKYLNGPDSIQIQFSLSEKNELFQLINSLGIRSFSNKSFTNYEDCEKDYFMSLPDGIYWLELKEDHKLIYRIDWSDSYCVGDQNIIDSFNQIKDSISTKLINKENYNRLPPTDIIKM